MQIETGNSIKGFLRFFKKKSYVINEKPFQINIVGLRNESTTPNKFDDKICVFWKGDGGIWAGKSFNVTTDPGTYWLKNPMSPQGTAILKEGQYIDAYKIGMHRGAYKALTQQKPVTVIRDYQRDAILDFNNGKEETGLFGINIHRASAVGTTKVIDKYSAGCQVFENADDFATFLELAEKSEALYGNNFTYTLIDERFFLRAIKRRSTYVFFSLLSALSLILLIRKLKNKK